jgi:hypothetical protein
MKIYIPQVSSPLGGEYSWRLEGDTDLVGSDDTIGENIVVSGDRSVGGRVQNA